MATIGVRCTKNEIFVAILEGTKQSPIITTQERANIKITAPKIAQSRAEELENLKTGFRQILDKYKPSYVGIKDHENSRFKIPIQSIAQRAEIEGVLQEMCFELNIPVEKLLYSSLKSKLKFAQKSKDFQMEQVDIVFELPLKEDNSKDAILCAWAVL